MSYILQSCHRIIPLLFRFGTKCNNFSSQVYHGGGVIGVELDPIEEFLRDSGGNRCFDSLSNERNFFDEEKEGEKWQEKISTRWSFVESARRDAGRVFETLRQYGPEFDVKLALNELGISVSGLLAREVLLRILWFMNHCDKALCAQLGYIFFLWSSQQEHYRPTVNSYHLLMEIFAGAEEFNAMWRLVDEMMDKGYPLTARTFNILLRTCGDAGLARKLVVRFFKSKSFNYRPFKHSYNAILHTLLATKHYKLVEWVYEQMLSKNHLPDVFTYNVVLWAKHRLGKLDQFQTLFHEMEKKGYAPDFHTFNLLLRVFGREGKPLSALDLLNQMRELGLNPTVLHFTTLIDGLSRAGDLAACRYFFDEMIKCGCEPDVVSYTVMITGYTVSGEFEKAQDLFNDMIFKGKLPNVFTYNSMIHGLCTAGRFDQACSVLKEMEDKGCHPNFHVYNTLVRNLMNAGKLSEAHDVIRQMIERGRYVHLVSKFKRHRCWDCRDQKCRAQAQVV